MNYPQEPFVYPTDIRAAPTELCKTLGWHHTLLRDLWGQMMNTT